MSRGAFRKADPGRHVAVPDAVRAMIDDPGEWFIIEEGAPRNLLGWGTNYGYLHAAGGDETQARAGFELRVEAGTPDAPGRSLGMGICTVYGRWVGLGAAETET